MNKYYVYGVNFKDNGKIYNFKSKFKCPINVTVIAITEKGEQFVRIVQFIGEKELDAVQDLNDIKRISTRKDYDQYLRNLKDAKKALYDCRNIVKELNLDMSVINATFTFDRNQLLFQFLAEERVDFRELAKRLASIYRTRIELRQIGARDKAREISGMGVCGRKLCCSSFLNHIDSVSMTMAKNQGLALNPSKINGLCGRLLCCLTYEDEEYIRCNEQMPEIGETISTPEGTGPVISKDILNRTYKVLINNEKIDISLGENHGSCPK